MEWTVIADLRGRLRAVSDPDSLSGITLRAGDVVYIGSYAVSPIEGETRDLTGGGVAKPYKITVEDRSAEAKQFLTDARPDLGPAMKTVLLACELCP